MNKTIMLLLSLFTLTMLCSCLEAETLSNAAYAQSVYEKMYTGDLSVIEQIDWQHLTILTNDYGSDYQSLENAEQQNFFKEYFITKFGSLCDNAGLIPQFLLDWRVAANNEDSLTVCADFYVDYLYLSFKKDGDKILLDSIYVEKL